jgi:hypothetical protein
MNEQDLILNIRKALDTSASKLPYKVSYRLSQSRHKALALHRDTPSVMSLGGSSLGISGELPIWRQVINFAFPALVVAVALYAIGNTRDAREVDATAAIDEAVLLDELPISAYTDNGYGVFLKNSRQ